MQWKRKKEKKNGFFFFNNNTGKLLLVSFVFFVLIYSIDFTIEIIAKPREWRQYVRGEGQG